MKNDDFLNLFQRLSDNKPEKTLLDYGQILVRRKWVVIASISSFLLAAFLYNTFSPKTYESSVTLKKENIEDRRGQDELSSIVEKQNLDKIDTEMKLLKTEAVLGKVINDLKLTLYIDKIEHPYKATKVIQEQYLNYHQQYLMGNPNGYSYPEFIDLNNNKDATTGEYYVEKVDNNTYLLFNAATNNKLQSSTNNSSAVFNLTNRDIVIAWPKAANGSKIFFSVISHTSALNALRGRISIEQDEETNLFIISAQAPTPKVAQRLAESIANKFMETRIEHQKESIQYSYKFVDEQLQNVTTNLEDIEDELRRFKTANKFVTMSERSTQIVQILSRLELEKVNNDLQLTETRKKLSEIESEYESSGYFDQTFLSPIRSTDLASPFSQLLVKLANLEVERIEALNRKRETHPDIVKYDEQISEVKSKLANYNQNTITAYQIIINTLKEKDGNLKKLIRKYSYQMAQLPSKETEYAEKLRKKNVYEKVFTLLLDKREELRMAELSMLQDITVVEAAQKPVSPTLPKIKLNYLFGLFFGVVFGLLGVVILEMKDRKKLLLDDIEAESALPIISIIPNYSKAIAEKIAASKKIEERFVTLMPNGNGYKETYRVLRTKLYSCLGNKGKMVMFTSCEENTGKSTIVANLAIMLAKAKKNVLMVDCDLKRARLTNMFNLSKKSKGLINIISDGGNLPIIKLLSNNKNSGSINLDIITSGGIEENSSDLLESDAFLSIMDNLNNSSYDYILVDTPPITRVVDALILAKNIKDTIVVVRPDYTLKDSFKWGVSELSSAETTIHGVVVNACSIEKTSFKNKYGYGYTYTADYIDDASIKNNGNGKKIKNTAPVA